MFIQRLIHDIFEFKMKSIS